MEVLQLFVLVGVFLTSELIKHVLLPNGHVGENTTCTTGSISRPTCMVVQPITEKHLIGKRITLYANSSATTRYRLLVAGDVDPNPGPVIAIDPTTLVDSNHTANRPQRITYNRDSLIQLNGNHRLPQQTWQTLKSLNLNAQTPTRRGKTGGRLLHNQGNLSAANNQIPGMTSGTRAKVGLWNARSINKKSTSVFDLVADNDLDILAICETWLHGDQRDDHIIAQSNYLLPNLTCIMYRELRRVAAFVF